MPAAKEINVLDEDASSPKPSAAKRARVSAPLTKDEIESKLSNVQAQQEKVAQEEAKAKYKMQLLLTKKMRLDMEHSSLVYARKRLADGDEDE